MTDTVEKIREIQQDLEIDCSQLSQILPQSDWDSEGKLNAIHDSRIFEAELLIAVFETMKALMPSRRWMKEWLHSPNIPMGNLIGVEMPIPVEIARSRTGLEGMLRYLSAKHSEIL